MSKMRCEDVHNLLPDYVSQDLGPGAEAMVGVHLDECGACAAVLTREQRVRDSLRLLPVPAMRPDFPARALNEVRRQARQQAARRTSRRLAIAASVLVVCGISFMLGRELGNAAPAPTPVSLPLGSAQMVELKINAPQAFDRVQFEVQLPGNVALKDQPELREFAWTGQLKAGVNVLSLPLVGTNVEDGGQLIATVRYGKTTKSLRIPLKVDAPIQG